LEYLSEEIRYQIVIADFLFPVLIWLLIYGIPLVSQLYCTDTLNGKFEPMFLNLMFLILRE